jgi:predicted  nucleic acid-binding Zn-ribbon protein
MPTSNRKSSKSHTRSRSERKHRSRSARYSSSNNSSDGSSYEISASSSESVPTAARRTTSSTPSKRNISKSPTGLVFPDPNSIFEQASYSHSLARDETNDHVRSKKPTNVSIRKSSISSINSSHTAPTAVSSSNNAQLSPFDAAAAAASLGLPPPVAGDGYVLVLLSHLKESASEMNEHVLQVKRLAAERDSSLQALQSAHFRIMQLEQELQGEKTQRNMEISRAALEAASFQSQIKAIQSSIGSEVHRASSIHVSEIEHLQSLLRNRDDYVNYLQSQLRNLQSQPQNFVSGSNSSDEELIILSEECASLQRQVQELQTALQASKTTAIPASPSTQKSRSSISSQNIVNLPSKNVLSPSRASSSGGAGTLVLSSPPKSLSTASMIARGDVEALSAEISKLTSNLELTSRQLADSQAASDKARASIEQLQSTLSSKETEIGKLSSTIDDMKSKLAEKDRELKNSSASSSMAIAECEKQKKIAAMHEAKVNELMKQLAKVNVDLENARGDVTKYSSVLVTRENEISILRGEISNLKEFVRQDRENSSSSKHRPQSVVTEPTLEPVEAPKIRSEVRRASIDHHSFPVEFQQKIEIDHRLPEKVRPSTTSENIFGTNQVLSRPLISHEHNSMVEKTAPFEVIVASKERELMDANLERSSLRNELSRLGEGLPKLRADRMRQADITSNLLPQVEKRLSDLRLWFKMHNL